MSRQISGLSPCPFHSSAMPTRPSTIISLRWVRLLKRSMSYQRCGWKYSKCTPPARNASTTSSFILEEPTQSALTCAFGECLHELVGDVAGPVDVGLHVHADLGRADRFEHRGEDLRAVLEIRDRVAVHDRRPEQVADLTTELRAFDR